MIVLLLAIVCSLLGALVFAVVNGLWWSLIFYFGVVILHATAPSVFIPLTFGTIFHYIGGFFAILGGALGFLYGLLATIASKID